MRHKHVFNVPVDYSTAVRKQIMWDNGSNLLHHVVDSADTNFSEVDVR